MMLARQPAKNARLRFRALSNIQQIVTAGITVASIPVKPAGGAFKLLAASVACKPGAILNLADRTLMHPLQKYWMLYAYDDISFRPSHSGRSGPLHASGHGAVCAPIQRTWRWAARSLLEHSDNAGIRLRATRAHESIRKLRRNGEIGETAYQRIQSALNRSYLYATRYEAAE